MYKYIKKPYGIAVILLLITLISLNLFVTNAMVTKNVITIGFTHSNLAANVYYVFIVVTLLLFLFHVKTSVIQRTPSAFWMFAFIIWTFFVSLVMSNNMLSNVKYSVFFILVFLAFFKLRYIEGLINFNIRVLQFIVLLMLGLSLVLIYESPIPTFRMNRDSVVFLNANEDAFVMTITFPFLFLIKRTTLRVVLVTYFFYFLIMYNATRSAIFAAFLTLIIIFNSYLRKHRALFVVLLLATTISLSGVFMEYVFNDSLFIEMTSIGRRQESGNRGLRGGDNMSGRIYGIWYPMINYIATESPVFGHGEKGYDVVSKKVTVAYSKDKGWFSMQRDAHNFFIMVLFSWGFVGLGIFLIIYITYMRMAYKLFRKYKTTLTAAVFSAWVSMTIMNFIANSFYAYKGWTMLSILMVLTYAIKLKMEKEVSRNTSLSVPQASPIKNLASSTSNNL